MVLNIENSFSDVVGTCFDAAKGYSEWALRLSKMPEDTEHCQDRLISLSDDMAIMEASGSA
jgi:hypothetical protein